MLLASLRLEKGQVERLTNFFLFFKKYSVDVNLDYLGVHVPLIDLNFCNSVYMKFVKIVIKIKIF